MSGDTPTLLVVDDEERILSALRRSLRREGWCVLTASTPDEALRILDEQPVDAVLSDHKMPRMSGLEVLEAAARRRPNAARILISGWPDEIPAERLAALGVRALVPKPWDDAELKRILREALAARR
ncbi:MAG: two-component system response regulator [Deltaproteobacteria bacterium]|nr:two-component system response regulator [Deltaproteobacteria bacterium]